jgi:hypothetical protein
VTTLLLIAVPIITALLTALVTGAVTFIIQERKLRTDLRTEFMAEEAVRQLLNSPKWEMRSFDEIRTRLGGFEDNELRKLLVRAGAIRFTGEGGRELWRLREKNEDRLR